MASLPLLLAADPLSRAEALAAEERYLEAAQLLSQGRALAATGTSTGPPPASREEPGGVEARIARYLILGNSPQLGLQAAEEALKAKPDLVEALWAKGEAERRLERAPEARATLERLLAVEPAHLPGKLALARTLIRLGEPARGLPLLEACLAGGAAGPDPVQAESRLEYGRGLTAAGRLAEAADQFAILLESEPEEANYYYELSRALFRMRRPEEGRFFQQLYDRASQWGFEELVEERLRESGRAGVALGQRASNLIRRHRFLEAIRSYRRGIGLEPQDPRLVIYLADLCLLFGRSGEALREVEAALARGAAPASGLLLERGRALLLLERRREAEAALAEGLKALAAEGNRGGPERGQADGQSLRVQFITAVLEDEAGSRLEEARAQAAELSARWPGWRAEWLAGRVDLRAGQPGRALEAFERGVKAGGGEAVELLRFRARALLESGRGPESIAELRRIVERFPGDLQSYEELARAAGALPPEIEKARSALAGPQARLKEALAAADGAPIESSAGRYLEAGRLCMSLRDPARAVRFLLLSVDLDHDLLEGYRLILSGLSRPDDLFLRIKLLREVLRLAPEDPAANRLLSTIYLKLKLRLDEAEEAARRLHEAAPSPESERLLEEVVKARRGGTGAPLPGSSPKEEIK
jgi:predicted Zn-dependent protease